jgi:hypothetical protein
MRRTQAAILLTSFLTIALTQNAPAQDAGLSISALAARDGYTMQWLLPERSVSLLRPGMAILVRPGASMYFVNNHVEFTDRTPVYNNGDLLVSPAFAARIARLASAAAAAESLRNQGSPQPQITVGEQPVTGAITMNARPIEGRAGVVVNGHAPSSAPVTVTLLATFSIYVPTVIVSRHDVQPDVNGNFQAEVPLGADYVPNTILRVVATSVAGTTPASAQFITGDPNAGVIVPLEQRLNPVPGEPPIH